MHDFSADIAADRQRTLHLHQNVAEQDIFNESTFGIRRIAAVHLDPGPGVPDDDIRDGAAADHAFADAGPPLSGHMINRILGTEKTERKTVFDDPVKIRAGAPEG